MPNQFRSFDLFLVAIVLFFVDNGCDWRAKNKDGETAIDVINIFRLKDLVEMFKLEGYRYSMMSKLRFTPSSELKDAVVSLKNEEHYIDSKSHTLCESTTPTKGVNSSCRTCNDM